MRLLGALLSLLTLTSGSINAQFAGGSGTVEDPYQVSTIEQLQEIDNYTTSHFIQINDIDASVTATWNDGAGFDPIGQSDLKFKGIYDGNGYTISHLHINKSQFYTGIFALTDGSLIKNLKVESVSIEGTYGVGIVVGQAHSTVFENIHVGGEVIGRTHVGGIVGVLTNFSTILESTSNIEIKGSEGSGISDSDNFGGLVGWNLGGEIYRSFSAGNISASNYSTIGGLVGTNNRFIIDSYTYTNINADSQGGGIAGKNTDNGIVLNSFAVNQVNGNEELGGIFGLNAGTEVIAYHDISINDNLEAFGVGVNVETVKGYSTSRLVGDSASFFMDELDFENIWAVQDTTYPTLLWLIAYFELESSSFPVAISEGETFDFYGTVRNKGGQIASQTIYLKTDAGVVLDSVITGQLSEDETESFTLSWLTELGDQGNYNLIVSSDNDEVLLEVSVLTKPGTPVLVSPASESVDVSLLPEFIWDEAPLTNFYQLEIATDDQFTSPVLFDSLLQTNVSLTDSLQYLTQYFWRVRGVSDQGEGDWSETWSFTTIIEKPALVSLETPADGTEEVSISPMLSWMASARAESYQIQLALAADFQSVLLDTSAVAGTSLSVSELNFNTDYYWRVKAVNVGGESDWSEIYTFFTEYALPKPSALLPSNNQQDVGIPTVFNWQPVEGAADYTLEVSLDSSFSSLLTLESNTEGSSSSKAKSWTISQEVTNLDFATSYYWRVRASNTLGNSDYSAVKSFVTDDAPLEGAVVLSSPEDLIEDVAFPVVLTWDNFTEGASYELQISQSPSFDTTLSVSNTTELSYTISDLQDTTSYYWRVRASVDDQATAWSDVWSFSTELRVPEIPDWSPLNNEVDVSLKPIFEWNASARASSYEIQLSKSSSFDSSIVSVSDITSTSYQLTEELQEGETYYWKVRAANESGNSDWSETLSFTTVINTSSEEDSNPTDYELLQNYPNPFNPSTQINYTIPESGLVRLTVVNSVGQEVATLVDQVQNAGNYSITFDASSLASGVYFYRIESGDFSVTRKMLLMK